MGQRAGFDPPVFWAGLVVTVTPRAYAHLLQCSFAGHTSRQREPLEKNEGWQFKGEGVATRPKSDRGGPDNSVDRHRTVAQKNTLPHSAEGQLFFWRARRDSNSRPPGSKPGTLSS